MSAEGLRVYAKATYGVSFTSEEAETHRNAFFKAYPGLARWHSSTRRVAAKESRSASGRRRLFHAFTADTERLNTPVQGMEADGAKLAMALLWERRARCPGAVPVLFNHDEVVVECDADPGEWVKAWLVEALEDGMQGFLDPVPVAVEAKVVPTWGG